MTWSPPPLKIKPPDGALTQGFPELPDGMLAWKNRKNKYVVLVCGYMSDPEARTPEWWDRATEGMLPHEIESEYLCSFASRGGMKVFPWLNHNPQKFTRSHTKYRNGDVWTIPNHWHLIGGLDYGGNRNPTSFHIYAIDEKKNWHSIHEYYRPSHFRETAEAILNHPLYDRLTKICLDATAFKRDQHDQKIVGAFTSIAELLLEAGVSILERANNDRLAGLARCLDIFNQRPGEDRASKFYISDDCINQWKELSEIVYLQESQLQLMHRNPSEDVEKKNDHAYDDWRYALMGWDSEAEMDPVKPDSPFALSVIEEEIEEDYRKSINDLFN